MSEKSYPYQVWMDDAICKNTSPSIFFPPHNNGGEVRIAQNICKSGDNGHPCPVKDNCLEYALAHNIDNGVWGGASERERRRIARSRRIEKARGTAGRSAVSGF